MLDLSALKARFETRIAKGMYESPSEVQDLRALMEMAEDAATARRSLEYANRQLAECRESEEMLQRRG